MHRATTAVVERMVEVPSCVWCALRIIAVPASVKTPRIRPIVYHAALENASRPRRGPKRRDGTFGSTLVEIQVQLALRERNRDRLLVEAQLDRARDAPEHVGIVLPGRPRVR